MKSGTEYYVKVLAVDGSDLGESRTVRVVKGGESYEVTFSAMSYARAKVGAAKASLAGVAKSLHCYYRASKAAAPAAATSSTATEGATPALTV